jgi:hypothetical protein
MRFKKSHLNANKVQQLVSSHSGLNKRDALPKMPESNQ